jgi:hypothetical protein
VDSPILHASLGRADDPGVVGQILVEQGAREPAQPRHLGGQLGDPGIVIHGSRMPPSARSFAAENATRAEGPRSMIVGSDQ